MDIKDLEVKAHSIFEINNRIRDELKNLDDIAGRMIKKIEEENSCPDDCTYRVCNACILDACNHCIRRAEDYCVKKLQTE